ncbi:MAG: hypothetical protein OCD76_10895 [Reichenbachiella sp.]
MNSIFNKILITSIVTLSMASCVPSPKKLEENKEVHTIPPLEEGYSMIFFRLDNYALIYIDDELAFDTRKGGGKENAINQIMYDLNDFINGNEMEIRVEGYNTECAGCQNNNYEYVYEIYKNGDGIEYVSEYSNHKNSAVGLSMTKNHTIDID